MAPTYQSNQSFQRTVPKQLVVLIRFKPAGFSANSAVANNLISKVSQPVKNAGAAVENQMGKALGAIGLDQMMITEEKKQTTSDKEYNYYKDYTAWDAALNNIKHDLPRFYPDSTTDVFEFSSTNVNDRKADAQKLYTQVKSKLAAWSRYTVWIHFIALAQGGSIANECTALLAADSQFMQEKWLVKSILYVASPNYKTEHLLNRDCLKGEGSVFAFGSRYDLTAGLLFYMEDNSQLQDRIANCNQNLLSLTLGKIEMKLVEIAAVLLDGLSFGTGSAGNSAERQYHRALQVVDSLGNETTDLIKQLKNDGTSLIQLDKLPAFQKIAAGYDQIPQQCHDRFKRWWEDFKNEVKRIAGSKNKSLSSADILKSMLVCFCPVFDAIANSLSVLKYGEDNDNALVQQTIEAAGLNEATIYAPASQDTTYLPVDTEYIQKAISAAKENKPDKAAGLISYAQNCLGRITATSIPVKTMQPEQKKMLADVITCMAQPMLCSKKDFYSKLLQKLPFDIHQKTANYNGAALMDKLKTNILSKLSITDYPADLQASIANMDREISRIRSYFDKNNFALADHYDSLYLMYNAHNNILKQPHGEVLKCLDQQTGYMNQMKQAGYDYTADYKYVPAAVKDKNKILPTRGVQEKAAN